MKLAEYKKLTNPISHCAVRIGIDAGRSTGIASHSLKYGWQLFTFNFWGAYDLITQLEPSTTGIVIEVPKKFLYGRNEGNGEKVGRRIVSDAGSNRREAELLADRFESLGYPVVRVTPTKSKWNAKELQRITGIKERTNEHTRDAVRLVWDYI